MTTIGRGSTAKIAGACDDGTVRIYDSVTGVLRLSLRPEFPVLEMTGVPDGSLLVCTHTGRPFITLWDLQTGGLVQTFILEGEVKGTTVSLNGRYLACEGSKTTVNFWETTSRTQHPVPWERFWGNTPCWVAPEELIMVVDQGSVYIQNVILKGPPIHKFNIWGSVHSAVYSQVFNRLVIMCPNSHGGNSFIIPDVTAGSSSTLHTSGERLSCVAFSQTVEQLVCGGGAPGLETVDISTGCRTCFDFPATLASISTLSNGTVVANFRGSGIQLLRLHQDPAPPQQPTPPPLTVSPLDEGRIITIIPTTNDRIVLLETSTMSQVLSIPFPEYLPGIADTTLVLHASVKNKIAVFRVAGWLESYVQIWEFSHEHPRWTGPTDDRASIGSISPACTRLVTFHNGSSGGSVRVWDARNGTPLVQKFIVHLRPLDITFDSEDRFYLHYNTHRIPYDINTLMGYPTTHSITPRAKQQLDGQVLEKRYCLDDGREWVLCGSQRICWIPPGYIGSAPVSHWWADSSLVMARQDGTLKKLAFLESSL